MTFFTFSRARFLSTVAICILAAGCSGAENPTMPPIDPGVTVSGTLPPEQQAELDKLLSEIDSSSDMTPAEFADLYKVPFASGLPYDPATAQNLQVIQSSPLALDANELAGLGKNGFVISEGKRFPTFVYGYESIYSADLPLFVSADSILFAVHRSYDEMLKAIETVSLLPDLDKMLSAMRVQLQGGAAKSLGAQAVADTDVYLAVAQSLLKDSIVSPVAGGSAADIQALYTGAKSAEGAREMVLFGASRDIDFSQFKPRGHYTDSPELERYFRSMMWLGRIDFRILEAQPDLSLKFMRRQLEGAYALRALIDASTQARWTRIDDTIQAFVGEADYMVLPELGSLLGDLHLTTPAGLASVPDQTIVQAVLDGGYGTQRISSHIMINGVGNATMPLSSSFALFGQRYVVDSHVFSNVVFDRVQHGKVYRMLPNPLDAAFAASGNNQAGMLLGPEIASYSYAPDLHAMRLLVDAHPAEYWTQNLYNLWTSSLRTLSPGADLQDPSGAGIPAVAATEPWGRRLLNTQLASWAELRHDTILYAKQSYTGGDSCEFPDAYVEPSPAFFQSIGAFAQYGQSLVASLDLSADPSLQTSIVDYFDRLADVAGKLQAMAEQQRTGTPFTSEQMAFINEAVVIQWGCGDPFGADGWYPKLFFSNANSVKFDPTIADVHTQPTEPGGAPIGRVLHVATGNPRLIAMTVDTCTGPRAYVGVVSSYFERLTEHYQRLDDIAWADELKLATPADVPWMTDLVVR